MHTETLRIDSPGGMRLSEGLEETLLLTSGLDYLYKHILLKSQHKEGPFLG